MEERTRIAMELTSRDLLISSLPKGGVFVELGVAAGGFTPSILQYRQPEQLFLIDSWCEQPGTEWQEKDPAALENHEQFYQDILHRYSEHPGITILRMLSEEAVKQFTTETIDGIYIDADHTKTAQDIEMWWPKIKPGGWMCGHDYVGPETVWITTMADVDTFVAQDTRLELIITNEEFPSWAIHKPL